MGDGIKTIIFSMTIALVITLGTLILATKLVTNNSSKEQDYNKQNSIANSTANSYSNISAGELKGYLGSERDIYLLDVHIPEQEHIGGTDDFIPFNDLTANKSMLPEKKETEIIVYCRSGNMSETSSQTLIDMGYTNVKNLEGGINAWKAQGYSL